MKRPGGTTEGGGDEGESSRIMVSGYHNHSIGTTFQQDQASFPNPSFDDAHFRNESNIEHNSYENTQELEFAQELEFVKSFLVEDNYVNNEESTNTYFNTFTQSESLRKVYDTDVEAVSQQVNIYCPNFSNHNTVSISICFWTVLLL